MVWLLMDGCSTMLSVSASCNAVLSCAPVKTSVTSPFSSSKTSSVSFVSSRVLTLID